MMLDLIMSTSRKLKPSPNYPFPSVVTDVSDNDAMLDADDVAHYLAVGASALENIYGAIAKKGVTNVRRVLDMPCGHGRVARTLRAAFPDAEIYVCDLDVDGVEFCAKTFGAHPLFAQPDFRNINFHQKFDVIWVGSLITHLPAEATSAFIEFTLRHLTDDGVAVLSSHGPFVAGRIQSSLVQGGEAYGTPNDAGWRMLSDYFSLGFGYADYPDNDASIQSYGVSLATREWMTATIAHRGGEVLFYRDHGWDRHHDVVAYCRGSHRG